MSVGIDKLASELQKVIEEKDKNKKTPYDTEAEVVRVDTEVVWVKIPGGVDETPVQKTVNAKVGDIVQVRVSGGRAFLVGNGTNPPTDDTVAHEASYQAQNAQVHAVNAEAAAADAQKSAENARIDASIAHQMADSATQSANEANLQAISATSSANSALDQLGIVENVVGVLDLLQKNGDYQVTQDEEVQGGKWYFTRSGASPDFVYSVVNNPTSVYYLTDDTAIESGKTYYTRTGTGTAEDQYVYTAVATPVAADIGTYYEKYYELVGIREAIQNYVSSKLAVDDQGLWLQTAGVQTKVLLSATDGVVLYGTDGKIVGKYGQNAQIGDSAGFHISIGVWYKLTEDTAIVTGKTYYTRSGTASNYVYTEVENPVLADIGTYYEQMPQELGFYQGQRKVAYINNNQLYITQSVVLQQMDLGTPVSNGGLGQWSWKVHANGQTPSRNNLNLKWIG